MRELKWAHVSDLSSDDGRQMGVHISVSSNTKTGSRTVLGRANSRDVLVRRRKESQFTGEGDYVFTNYAGGQFGFHGKTFNTVLEALDLKQDSLGQLRSLYSARHTYITRKLEAGVRMRTLAKQTGTSMQNIEKIYGHHSVMDEKDKLLE